MSQSVQTSPEDLNSPSRLSSVAQILLGLVALAYFIYAKPELARTIAIFVVTLGVLVFVHEWGHYQFARWAGMKVNRFALGFPPFIYTIRRNNIDYSIGALPIGGMVDIAGLGSEEEMVHESRQNVEDLLEKTNVGAETDHEKARQEIYRDPSRPFGERQFQDGSLFWRFMVLFAGPLMNFLLAIVVFIGVFSVAGMPIPSYKPQVEATIAGDPAAKAGLKAKDEIIAVGGKKTPLREDLAKAIQSGKGKPTTLTVLRDGKTFQVTLTPVYKDIYNDGKKVPSIGVAFDQSAIHSFTYQKMGPVEAIQTGFISSMNISLNILDTIKRAVSRNLSSEEVKSIGGPVKIAQTVGQVSQFGIAVALVFAAQLSVNLGLMNLLPLPALDGGRIMFLGYELVARRPFNPRWEGVVHAAGMLMLLSFMLFITLRDVNAGAFFERFIH